MSAALSIVEPVTGMLSVEKAAALLRESCDLGFVREVRDHAKAVQVLQQARRASLDAQTDAAEIVLRADRRLGELCKEVTGGKAGAGKRHGRGMDRSNSALLLSDLDITKAQSSRWQRLAAVPEPVFEQHIVSVRARGEKLTTVGAIGAVSLSPGYDGDER